MDHKRAEEVAANRLQIISPLMDPTLDKAKRQELKETASIQYGISERTIRRWMNNYHMAGFEGLKPKAPETSGTSKIPEVLINEAIQLRREVPKRSISEIIRILEWEGLAEKGFLRKSTLQDQLAARGYSSRQMKTYAKDVTPVRGVSRNHGGTTCGSRTLNTGSISMESRHIWCASLMTVPATFCILNSTLHSISPSYRTVSARRS